MVNICNLRNQTHQFMNAIPTTYRTFNHKEEENHLLFIQHRLHPN